MDAAEVEAQALHNERMAERKELRTLRVQLDEEHQAFLAEQVATQDAIRELDALRAENERLIHKWAKVLRQRDEIDVAFRRYRETADAEKEQLQVERTNAEKVRDAAIGRLKAGGLEVEIERLLDLMAEALRRGCSAPDPACGDPTHEMLRQELAKHYE